MKATVNYISKSGKSASITVKQQFGLIESNVSGFVGIPEGTTLELKQELDIPATKVVVEQRTSAITAENPVARVFDYLVFSN